VETAQETGPPFLGRWFARWWLRTIGANLLPVCIGECVSMVRTWLRISGASLSRREFTQFSCVKALRERLCETLRGRGLRGLTRCATAVRERLCENC
jgi:hypothetical protein